MVEKTKESGGVGAREREDALVIVANNCNAAMCAESDEEAELRGAGVLELIQNQRSVASAWGRPINLDYVRRIDTKIDELLHQMLQFSMSSRHMQNCDRRAQSSINTN
jgi:hypothetical protein